MERGSDNTVVIKSQVLDYRCRGNAYEKLSVLEFLLHTYELVGSRNKASHGSSLFYVKPHPHAGKRARFQRPDGHNTLPNFGKEDFKKPEYE